MNIFKVIAQFNEVFFEYVRAICHEKEFLSPIFSYIRDIREKCGRTKADVKELTIINKCPTNEFRVQF